MIGQTLFALLESIGKPEQYLEIVGGAALGALGLGLIAQLLTRWLAARKLPHFPTLAARGVGGVAAGLLTAMWVWQGGGWGPGGPGGGGSGTGTDAVAPDTSHTPAKLAQQEEPNDQNKPPEKEPPLPPESVLRLEVLTDEAVRQTPGAGEPAVQAGRFYKVEGGGDPGDLRTLDQTREFLQKRLSDNPPLQRVDIVTRPGKSPDKTAGRVMQLRQAITDLAPKLSVEFPPR